MKHKIYLVLAFVICGVFYADRINAQKVYMAVKGETSTPYYSLEEAVEAAEAGSTIYIPSGVHTIKKTTTIEGNRPNTILIEKKLNLVGAGADEGVLHGTVIEGNLVFIEQASESYMTGFTLNGELRWNNVSRMIMKRCKINSGFFPSGSGSGNRVEECELAHIHHYKKIYSEVRSGEDFVELKFTNNIIKNLVKWCKEALFFNNVFTFLGSNCLFESCVYCIISNNIITSPYAETYLIHGSYNMYNYNLTVKQFGTPSASSYCTVADNIANVDVSTIFDTNYHLKDNSAGKKAGSDGTDVGIYGGAVPAKERRIPVNPSFTEFSVGGTSNKDGKLPVVIKVEAQVQ